MRSRSTTMVPYRGLAEAKLSIPSTRGVARGVSGYVRMRANSIAAWRAAQAHAEASAGRASSGETDCANEVSKRRVRRA